MQRETWLLGARKLYKLWSHVAQLAVTSAVAYYRVPLWGAVWVGGGGMSARHPSLESFVAWLELAPSSTTIAAPELLATLRPLTAQCTPSQPPDAPTDVGADVSWRERLWVVPSDVRLGVNEAAEAFGRPRSWVYKHTSEKATSGANDRLPFRKFDGELVFTAGELRQWLTDHEEVVVRGRITSTLSLSRAS